MTRKALFGGLVIDENGRPAETAYVGNEPCYVVDDAGFHRHIPSEQIDRAVLGQIAELMKGSEDIISAQAAKMLGQEDIFTRAIIEQQIKNMDRQFDAVLETGIPENARAYLGMLGFKVVIDVHGKVLRVEQPGMAGDDEGE